MDEANEVFRFIYLGFHAAIMIVCLPAWLFAYPSPGNEVRKHRLTKKGKEIFVLFSHFWLLTRIDSPLSLFLLGSYSRFLSHSKRWSSRQTMWYLQYGLCSRSYDGWWGESFNFTSNTNLVGKTVLFGSHFLRPDGLCEKQSASNAVLITISSSSVHWFREAHRTWFSYQMLFFRCGLVSAGLRDAHKWSFVCMV